MKKAILFLIIILFASCSKKKELQGFWYGKYVRLGEINDEVVPILLKFNKDNYIDYMSLYDTIEYLKVSNRIYTPRSKDEIFNYSFKLKDSTLDMYSIRTGEELNLCLKRSENKNFLFDFLTDKTLHIDLPNSKKNDETLGLDFYFIEPLYLTYKDNQLVSFLRAKTKLVNTNYYKFLLRETYDRSFDIKYPITLIADKNIKIADLRLLEKQLKLADFNNIRYMMKSNEYDKAKAYPVRLQRLSDSELNSFSKEKKKVLKHLDSLDDELAKRKAVVAYLINETDNLDEFEPPEKKVIFNKEHSILVKIDNKDIKINEEDKTLKELKNLIQSRLKKDSRFYITLYITDDSTYQNYIDFLDVSYKVALDLQEEYLKKEYNLEKNPRNYSTKYKDRIKESKYKYPFALWLINEAEYEDVIKNL